MHQYSTLLLIYNYPIFQYSKSENEIICITILDQHQNIKIYIKLKFINIQIIVPIKSIP